MSYVMCPHCRSSNSAGDETCYNCEKSMMPAVSQRTQSGVTASSPDIDMKVVAHSLVQAFVAIGLVTIFGAALGVAWDSLPLDLPFLLEEVSLGVLCAVTAAFLLGKFQDLRPHQLSCRLLPAAAFGAIVGFCMYCVWWGLDLPVGPLVIGACAGFFSGLPIVVSFGLFGGESRPMGGTEFLNMGAGLLVGGGLGFFLAMDAEESNVFFVVLGLLGLVPALVGGRVNMWEAMSRTERR